MKQAKRTVIYLSILLLISVVGFIISMAIIEDNSALVTVIFRTVMAGSLVGLITAFINYYSAKERILQDFSNDLLTSYTEFFNFRKEMKQAADRIRHRDYYFDTQEFSIWMQALSSAANETKGTLIVPYKYDPFIKKGVNKKIIQYMNEYIKADRQLWDEIDDAKYEMMLARMAIEENHTIEEELEKQGDDTESTSKHKKYIKKNNEEVNKLVDMLEEIAATSHRFKEFSLEINKYLANNTTISLVLEIESSERTSYQELMEKARTQNP